jgi:hypothetical protein
LGNNNNSWEEEDVVVAFDPSLTRAINIMTIMKTLRDFFIYLSMGSC